jgi:Flp pilus assembly CpaF family ATPase
MNPSRVIVGEVLGDEIVTMLNAMTQGNDGSLSTIHANSSMEVFNRIATYAIQAAERLPVEATHMLIAGAVDFVVKPVSPERLEVSVKNALKIEALAGEQLREARREEVVVVGDQDAEVLSAGGHSSTETLKLG